MKRDYKFIIVLYLKHKILKFEPMSELSNSYNFLSEVRYGTNYEIEDCRIIGTMIVGEDESKDPFWGDSAPVSAAFPIRAGCGGRVRPLRQSADFYRGNNSYSRVCRKGFDDSK